MKKILSLIMSICVVIAGLPMTVYAASSTPEISLDEFSDQLSELISEYDSEYIPEITIEDGSEFCHVGGEVVPLSVEDEETATVTEDDFEIPTDGLAEYEVIPEEETGISTFSVNDLSSDTLDKESAEDLGFEVDIEDDTVTLSQPYQTQRLIVKSKYDIDPLDSVAIVEGYNDLHIVQFDSQESAKAAQEYYEKQNRVEYAEPDLVVSTAEYDEVATTAADEDMGINYGEHLSWGSEAIGVDDYIDYLPSVDQLPEIVVGIIDTGIDYDHEFLKDRVIRTNYNISSSGNENDENDDDGHGSHVAGIVVDNSTSNVKVKGYKVLDNEGYGTISGAAIAVEYATADEVNVINMSLGVRGTSEIMEEAVNAATDAGITVCVSAGNNGQPASENCPANIENCITVMALGKDGDNYLRPYWTSWGNLVDLGAPGMSIYSTYMNNGYETLSGTSMACPFVTAAAALLLSRNPEWNSEEICTTLEDNAIFLKDEYEEINFLYIGTITEYNEDRTVAPEFTVESGRYSDSVTIEIVCSDPNTEIYYTLDGSRASKATGILYTGPIVIDKVTRVHACAYSGDKLKSLQVVADYYITVTDPEENFVIDTNGIITEYNGNNNYLTIPDTIGGIAVTGIGRSAFSNSDIAMIKFPDTLTYVGPWAFYNCKSLTAVYCKNMKVVDDWAFRSCRNLDTVDISQLEELGEYGFGNCSSLTSVYNDKLTRIEKGGFASLTFAVGVDLPNVTYVGNMGLTGLNNAEYINLPKVEELGTSAISHAFTVEELYFPKLTTMTGYNHFAQTHNLKIFYAPNLTIVPQMAFSDSYIEYLDLPSVEYVETEAFFHCRAKVIKLTNASEVEEKAFSNCLYLETLYLPSLTHIPVNAFAGNIDDSKMENNILLFAPSLQTAESLPTNIGGMTLYVSEDFESSLVNPERDYTIIASTGSYAEQWANENGYTFINSDNIAEALGGQIRTRDSGLRFGFTLDSTDIGFDYETIADDVEYGFVYTFDELSGDENAVNAQLKVDNAGTYTIEAAKRNVDGTISQYNAVFTGIPESHYDSKISARAYLYIDGMYFYSPVTTRSFNDVANAVINDETMDSNTRSEVYALIHNS